MRCREGRDLHRARRGEGAVGESRHGGVAGTDRDADVRRDEGSLTAFLELHVEQGAVMDQDGIDALFD